MAPLTLPKVYSQSPEQWLRSEKNLKLVHPDLVRVYRRAVELSDLDPVVTCGARTLAEQKLLFAKGATKTLNSRHLIARNGYSHAIDVAFIFGKDLRWDWPLYKKFADEMKRAGKELGVPVEWGGDWRSFPDGPHFQLPFGKYPK
jgi:peptidoglycan L-alanyl-D-glutamate endopeptidase CwlK